MEGITVLWVSGLDRKVEPYKPAVHLKMARDFLFWQNGADGKPLIIIGDGIYGFTTVGHAGLKQSAKKFGAVIPNGKPDGAGNFSFMSQRINGWDSFSFGVVTPAELRLIIERALGIK